MARVTVEDCIDKVDNRFELVLLASHRAKQLSRGSRATIDRQGDKNTVLALREIARETISVDDLKEELIQSLQRHSDVEDPEVVNAPLISHDSDNAEQLPPALSSEVVFENLSEEEIQNNLSKLVPPQKSDDYNI